MKQPNNPFFIFLLLLSGFAGISYEILYGRILGNLIGDQWAISASILLTFLLGIGIGTLFAHRFWRFLWLIEGGISLYAIAFALGTEFIESWMYSGMEIFGRGLTGNIIQCILLLSVPSFLIGCSLPLFAGYLSRLSPGRSFARAYAIHTFGAVLTILFVEFMLLRLIGIRKTVLTVASVNAFVSVALFMSFKELWKGIPKRAQYVHFPVNHVIALACASVASAVFQLWMVRIADLIIGPYRETFALVLGIVLSGIAIGSALVNRFRLSFSHLLIANMIGLVWLTGGFQMVAEFYASLYQAAGQSYYLSILLKMAILSLFMGVPAITFGGTVPALMTTEENVARESGQLLFVSSMANAAGYLLMVFVLHQSFSYGGILLVIAALSCCSLFVYSTKDRKALAGGILLAAGIFSVWNITWDENILYVGHASFSSPGELQENRDILKFPEVFKGRHDVFALNEMKNGDLFFFINGYRSMNLRAPSEKVVGAFSSLLAPRTDRALILGAGSGVTAGTVGLLFDHTDAVEINPVVLQNLYRMSEFNFDIETMPGVSIIHDDAIHYTKTNDQQYSLIINTVTTPLYFSSSKLYTLDFLAAVKQRLSPDGVYVTWIDARAGDRGVDIMLKTLSRSFNKCWLGYIKHKYFLLACSREDIAMHHPDVLQNEKLAGDLLLKHGVRTEWLPYQLLNTNVLSLISDNEVPLNTLDYPALEFEIARLRQRGIEKFINRLQKEMNVRHLREAIEPAGGWNPVLPELHASAVMGDTWISRQWHSIMAQEIPDYKKMLIDEQIQYSASIAKEQKNAQSYRDLGFELLTMGRLTEAVDQFKKSLAIDPSVDNTNLYLADTYEGMGLLDEALKYYEKEMALDPDDSFVYLGKGRIYMKTSRFEEALAQFDKLVELSGSGKAYFYRGLAFESLGDRASARASFEKALSINPQDGNVQAALSRLD